MFDVIQNSLLSLVYPQTCRICSSQVESINDGVACSDCWNSTRIFDGFEMLCDKCGAFLLVELSNDKVFCKNCETDCFEKSISLGVYERALSASIVELKSSPKIPGRIKMAIRETVRRNDMSKMDLVIPVPLSMLRLNERGFNQAAIIANEIANVCGIPIDSSSLVRVRNTQIHRIGMDKKARELTVNKAFEVRRPKLITDKNILLVDDVFTSGATSSSCAQILKKNGANKVMVFTLARAVVH